MAGLRFTDTPKARREQWKMEQHKKKSALKLQKSNYRLEERKKKDAMKLAKSNYKIGEMKKKEAMKQETRTDYLHRKRAAQEASWGHLHPKR